MGSQKVLTYVAIILAVVALLSVSLKARASEVGGQNVVLVKQAFVMKHKNLDDHVSICVRRGPPDINRAPLACALFELIDLEARTIKCDLVRTTRGQELVCNALEASR
jgi:hypothetical protein